MIFVVFNALIIASAILVYAERKIMGFMQQRYGPYLVGPARRDAALRRHHQAGLQGRTAAQGRRQVAVHAGAGAGGAHRVRGVLDRALRRETTLFGLLDTPIKLGVSDVNVGVLVVFAVTSMGVYGIVLAGWASNSKYSLFGGCAPRRR
jgi:NADH-quinone oxidoreductase subunit H